MLLRNLKAYSATLSGNASPDYSTIETWSALAACSSLAMHTVVRYVSASVDLTLALEASFDGVNWTEVWSDTHSLDAQTTNSFMDSIGSSSLAPAGPLRRVRVKLESAESAAIDICVAGRGRRPKQRAKVVEAAAGGAKSCDCSSCASKPRGTPPNTAREHL